LECEICKTKFPSKVKIGNNIIRLIDIEKIESSHIVLEDAEPESPNGIHAIGIEKNEQVKLGRGTMSDVMINDASVSRVHASIKMTSDGPIVKDL